jgi:hypothetical protein
LCTYLFISKFWSVGVDEDERSGLSHWSTWESWSIPFNICCWVTFDGRPLKQNYEELIWLEKYLDSKSCFIEKLSVLLEKTDRFFDGLLIEVFFCFLAFSFSSNFVRTSTEVRLCPWFRLIICLRWVFDVTADDVVIYCFITFVKISIGACGLENELLIDTGLW